MSTTTKSLSASYKGVRYGITEKTACLFMLKVREAMFHYDNIPIGSAVYVNESVLDCREEKRQEEVTILRKRK